MFITMYNIFFRVMVITFVCAEWYSLDELMYGDYVSVGLYSRYGSHLVRYGTILSSIVRYSTVEHGTVSIIIVRSMLLS